MSILYFIAGFSAIYLLLSTLLKHREKKIWNGGTSANTGLPWASFDTDSSGARGFKAGGDIMWFSWYTPRSQNCLAIEK